MQNFKMDVAERLSAAVKKYDSSSEWMQYKEVEEGFYCDYAMQPLNPAAFSAIEKNMTTDGLSCAFQLSSFSGVYAEQNAASDVLQRIYVAAFARQAELAAYTKMLAEAAKRDHKTLGNELKLFSHDNEIGQGLTLWNPKGAMLRYLVESFGQAAHMINGYQWVYTPHIGKASLWETSGHLDFYRDSMYSPIVIDKEEYYLKPMNCPFHISIYNSELRSYRELPIKYAEYGTVYRYELSGALNGLTRVRGFTQDDAHIICMPNQVEKEISDALQFSLYMLRSFGFEKFQPYISTKPKTKFIGDDAEWEFATEILKKTVTAAGLAYQIDEGGGAFYGPKIDLKLTDALNREWQCSTIQFDFNLPARFQMRYVDKDGCRHTPCMVHRALFGSLERFLALLIEHYKGDFPLWLAPVQFGIVPIHKDHNSYAKSLQASLRNEGFRCAVNDGSENMRNKIKGFQLEKVPYLFIVGDKEMADGTFSVRSRKDGDLGVMDMQMFKRVIEPEIELGKARCILE